MKKEERKIWYYESERLGKQKVYCSRYEYLFLKLHYDVNGLTADEFREYKNYNKI